MRGVLNDAVSSALTPFRRLGEADRDGLFPLAFSRLDGAHLRGIGIENEKRISGIGNAQAAAAVRSGGGETSEQFCARVGPNKAMTLSGNKWLRAGNRASVWSRTAWCRPDTEDPLMRSYLINANHVTSASRR